MLYAACHKGRWPRPYFPLQNVTFSRCNFATGYDSRRPAVRIGKLVVSLWYLSSKGITICFADWYVICKHHLIHALNTSSSWVKYSRCVREYNSRPHLILKMKFKNNHSVCPWSLMSYELDIEYCLIVNLTGVRCKPPFSCELCFKNTASLSSTNSIWTT